MEHIGFVGLGHMGLPMAVNLLKAGYQVTGYDVNPRALQSFAEAGGQTANTVQETARDKTAVITMLQTGEQVQQVCLGEQGLFASAGKNTLFIDCSSIDVQSSQTMHQTAQTYQHAYLDAPVSGGVAGASAASLTFMVGGTRESFNRANPILRHLGKNIIHTGKAGSGQAAKICNNMILGISMIAVSEAFILAKHLGLEAGKLFEVVSNSSGQCWAMSKYVPVAGILENVPANHDYQPGFASAMMLKDLNLSQTCAAAVGVKTPMGAHATELYQQFAEQGNSSLDFSAIIKLLESF
ncbi:3-hydroxyisobutyrate dehydrogenase [Legionella sp. 27cVA30]|uniref:3-hydroxyisobutyrate dehydrogenase n=1 Tax=Legionella sp. 27cVA30 TaxID=2905657 RepID=UPI00209D0BE1|nr:3-hydroxyisobutyrate dehydrogenase [Legionella sp. 27cVA30]MCP0914722.1 3-hydroxyisobutyrate dehydrogenase [Legionella sp. 27cVA30]